MGMRWVSNACGIGAISKQESTHKLASRDHCTKWDICDKTPAGSTSAQVNSHTGIILKINEIGVFHHSCSGFTTALGKYLKKNSHSS